MIQLPVIAIVGKPNVGKSTLFNRLLGSKLALVYDEPGITRDRHYATIEWGRNRFTLIDTGGYELEPESAIFHQMRKQVEIAMSEADLILWVVDGREEITVDEREVGKKLRQTGKPVLLVVNKIDHTKQELLSNNFYELGIEKIFGVSAEHGRGISDLLDTVVEMVPCIPSEIISKNRESFEVVGEKNVPPLTPGEREKPKSIRVTILGRPNAGKSTLLNYFFGAPRAIVHSEPGTTRDPLNISIEQEGIEFEFIDTAGIRKKSHSEGKVEKVSVLKALRSLEKSDVALLLIDAEDSITAQDGKIAQKILEKYKPFLILVNKWDLVDEKTEWQEFKREVGLRNETVSFVPLFPISAKTGRGISRIFREIKKVYDESRRRLTTGELNRVFQEMLSAHPPPTVAGKSINLFYMTQTGEAPPRFVVMTNRPTLIPETYKRYLIGGLRKKFSFRGVPIRLEFKARKKKRFHG